MRVNARLDDQSQAHIHYLTQTTGKTVSEVLREAVAELHNKVRAQQPRPKSKFLALIGTGDSGRSDIASNVREHGAQILQAKHNLSPRRSKP